MDGHCREKGPRVLHRFSLNCCKFSQKPPGSRRPSAKKERAEMDTQGFVLKYLMGFRRQDLGASGPFLNFLRQIFEGLAITPSAHRNPGSGRGGRRVRSRTESRAGVSGLFKLAKYCRGNFLFLFSPPLLRLRERPPGARYEASTFAGSTLPHSSLEVSPARVPRASVLGLWVVAWWRVGCVPGMGLLPWFSRQVGDGLPSRRFPVGSPARAVFRVRVAGGPDFPLRKRRRESSRRRFF